MFAKSYSNFIYLGKTIIIFYDFVWPLATPSVIFIESYSGNGNIIFKCYFIYNIVCLAMLSHIFHINRCRPTLWCNSNLKRIYTKLLARDFFVFFLRYENYFDIVITPYMFATT